MSWMRIEDRKMEKSDKRVKTSEEPTIQPSKIQNNTFTHIIRNTMECKMSENYNIKLS